MGWNGRATSAIYLLVSVLMVAHGSSECDRYLPTVPCCTVSRQCRNRPTRQHLVKRRSLHFAIRDSELITISMRGLYLQNIDGLRK